MSEWRVVPNFSKYEACEDGRIRKIRNKRELKPSVTFSGVRAPVVSLVSDKVHVLDVRYVIACTFLGVDITARPKPKLEYIDGNRFNNSASNIRIKCAESLEGERWRPVKDFETSYAVSNFGRVKRLARVDTFIRKDTGKEVERHVSEMILKLQDADKYYEVNLFQGDRSVFRDVHRMVAQAFIPNPNNLPQVNHINGDKHDNRAENLEWCTSQHNVQHSIQTGLRPSLKGSDRSPKQVRCIETGQVFDTVKAAAEAFNADPQFLSERTAKGKTCHGYHFEIIVTDRRVKCLDTGEVFSNLIEVRDRFGVNPAEAIQRRTCADGWTFCYLRDDVDEAAYLQECREKYSRWPRANKRWERENHGRE